MKKDNYIEQMKNITPSEDLIKKTISNIQQAQKVEKIKKQSKWKKLVAGVVAATTLTVGSVGAYVAISGNTEILQKLGINISQNYEKNKQDVTNLDITDFVELYNGIEAKLVSVSIDNANLIMEMDIKLDEDKEFLNPDLNVNDVSILRPSSNAIISDTLEISQKCSSKK